MADCYFLVTAGPSGAELFTDEQSAVHEMRRRKRVDPKLSMLVRMNGLKGKIVARADRVTLDAPVVTKVDRFTPAELERLREEALRMQREDDEIVQRHFERIRRASAKKED